MFVSRHQEHHHVTVIPHTLTTQFTPKWRPAHPHPATGNILTCSGISHTFIEADLQSVWGSGQVYWTFITNVRTLGKYIPFMVQQQSLNMQVIVKVELKLNCVVHFICCLNKLIICNILWNNHFVQGKWHLTLTLRVVKLVFIVEVGKVQSLPSRGRSLTFQKISAGSTKTEEKEEGAQFESDGWWLQEGWKLNQ